MIGVFLSKKVLPKSRLQVLKELIRLGEATTQEGLCEALRQKKYSVTQSTISRDLRRIGAIKAIGIDGETIYKLSEETSLALPPRASQSLPILITELQSNESMIVLHTTPGSASLVARHLDARKQQIGILGTIAGDDTIFVVPESVKKINDVIKKISEQFLTPESEKQ